jgi:hypothetical protein
MPLLEGRSERWRSSFLIEYYSEGAWPWLVGMGYKAVRTTRYKHIRWIHHEGMDELYDLERDPYELINVVGDARYADALREVRSESRRLTADAFGLE